MSDQVHEPEVSNNKVPPLFGEAYEALNNAGSIDYGESILWDEFMPMINIPKENRNSWAFREEWFGFCSMCESEKGLITSERGMNQEGFRFLAREEMAEYVAKRELRKSRDSIRKSVCLSSVPREGLNDDQVRKLNHWETKSAFVGAVSQALLRKRKLIGDPQKMAKRIAGSMKDE